MTAAPAKAKLAPHAVGLAVRDLDAVAGFYLRVLGLQELARTDAAIQLGAGDVPLLELLHRPAALPDDAAEAGLYHTAFLLPSRTDLGRWLAHAGALRQRIDGAADHLVSEAVYLSDPEGNGVEVYADRPSTDWQWTEQDPGGAGPRIRMANARLDAAGLLALAGTEWSGAPAGTSIGHVHLRVGDVAAATSFYAGLLGMDVTAGRGGAVFLSTGGYHHHIAANSWDSAGAGPRHPDRAGLAYVAMAADAATLAAIAARAATPDLSHTGLRDPWSTLLRFG